MTPLWSWGLLLTMMVLICASRSQEFSDSEEDWLDPTDMFGYESGKMKPTRPKQIIEPSEDTIVPASEEKRLEKDYEREEIGVSKKVEDKAGPVLEKLAESDCQQMECSCPSGGKEGAFFKQFVNNFLQHFPLVRTEHEVYQITVSLKENDFSALEKFSQSNEGLEDAHEVLTSMIENVRGTDRPHYNLLQRIEMKLGFDFGSLLQMSIVFFICTLSIILLVRLRIEITLGRLFFKIVVLMFCVSVPWNWWYLYKIAVAKRESEMLKSVPEECFPQGYSASKSFITWLSSTFSFADDECAKYHERLMVDPMWEVPPTQALAVTITKFFLEPFKHIGTAFSELVKGLLVDIPVQLWPIVIGLFTFFVLFLCLIQSGYKVKLLWNIIGLEPATPVAHPSVENVPSNKSILQLPSTQSERVMIEEQPISAASGTVPSQKTNVPQPECIPGLPVTKTQSDTNQPERSTKPCCKTSCVKHDPASDNLTGNTDLSNANKIADPAHGSDLTEEKPNSGPPSPPPASTDLGASDEIRKDETRKSEIESLSCAVSDELPEDSSLTSEHTEHSPCGETREECHPVSES